MWTAIDPTGAHATDTLLLRQLEYDLRSFAWSFSDEKDRGEEPQPITLPGEEEAYQRAEEEADERAAELARAFGLNI